jgi:hypothetical protein
MITFVSETAIVKLLDFILLNPAIVTFDTITLATTVNSIN